MRLCAPVLFPAGWEIQNSTKTDRNLFFASKNLLQLEAQLDAGDAGAQTAAKNTLH
jgi:hypothetical protein